MVSLLFTLAASAASAETETSDALAWRWTEGQHQRYYVETEVQLPLYMWFSANYNKQARAAAFQLRMVMDCEAVAVMKRSTELGCAVEEVGIKAAALAGDTGLLQPVIEEMDEKLSEATLQVIIRNDGRIANIDLEDVNMRNRRISQMKENLRLISTRAIAGFDLQLPRKGAHDPAWAQYDSILMHAPIATRTSGVAEVIHQIDKESAGRVAISSAGRGVMVLSNGDGFSNNYDTRLESRAIFDAGNGVLTQRKWTVMGDPTASSLVAEGTQGLPYAQRGSLVLLGPDDEMSVGETLEVAPPGDTQSTLNRWMHLGEDLGPLGTVR